MAKYIKAKGTRSRASSSDALRNQLLRDLESEGRKILKSLTEQFTNDLQATGTKLVEGLFSSGGTSSSAFSGAGLTNLFGSALNYALNRPKTNTSTKESARSRQTEDVFRLSRSQALAEAASELSKGDKNR